MKRFAAVRNQVVAALAAAGLAWAAAPLEAQQTLELTNGVRVTGKARSVDNAKRPYTLLETEDGLRVALPQGDIRRTRSDELTEQYRRLAAAVPDDAEAHFEMARWCTKNRLKAQSRFHMRRVIELDPEHGTAREALGYVKRRDEWIPRAQWERERGLVRSGGRYHLPEDLAEQLASKETQTKIKRWAPDIARLRKTVLRGGDRAAEALQALQAIDDPLAAVAIGDELTDPRNRHQPQSLRLLWVDLLGRMRTPAAVRPLVEVGVKEPDPVIREAALERLSQYGYRSAQFTYAPMLKSSNNKEVNSAAAALAELPNPELRFQLVDALVTEHVVPKGGPSTEMNVMMGQNGGAGGLQMGGKPTTKKERKTNPHVLAALKVIAPEVDFQYDEPRWRQYFAQQLSSYRGDLRRDR
ncbi:HEAT repeat domain-containing protein [Roseimaritima sediminicola]|uniref:HEAT repeat domain-containing protein n=1 Tax=Roseimaritima sediminicola TaxID=2662066 RepID=UPI0012985418|nr:HEAT repeat domain-containing protein [Roseimaritima sediminicola]